MPQDGLGRGIAFPPRLDARGQWAFSSGPQNIRESIQLILSTSPGERLNLPGFGAGLRTFLYEPNTATTRRLIQEAITRALARWEPRITVEAVSVEADPDNPEVAVAGIHFRVNATGTDERMSLKLALAPSGDE